MQFEPTRTIDISAICANRASSADRDIAEALIEHGAFTATGFTQPANIGERMRQLLRFFSMPEEHKLACATCKHVPHNRNNYRGFYPLPEQQKWSHNETFDIGPEPALRSPDVPGADSFREPNVWPQMEPIPKWGQLTLAMAAFERGLSLSLMAALARGLGLEENTLLAPSLGQNLTLRLLHYAPAPAGFRFTGYDESENEDIGDGRRLLARSHVDTGLLALLWQNTVGLQMYGSDGVWREVPDVEDALSVHCGNLLEPLTGAQLQGTLHRVVGLGTDRCAVGFWLEPDFETEIVEPGTSTRVSYAQHLVNEFPERFERADCTPP